LALQLHMRLVHFHRLSKHHEKHKMAAGIKSIAFSKMNFLSRMRISPSEMFLTDDL